MTKRFISILLALTNSASRILGPSFEVTCCGLTGNGNDGVRNHGKLGIALCQFTALAHQILCPTGGGTGCSLTLHRCHGVSAHFGFISQLFCLTNGADPKLISLHGTGRLYGFIKLKLVVAGLLSATLFANTIHIGVSIHVTTIAPDDFIIGIPIIFPAFGLLLCLAVDSKVITLGIGVLQV